MDDVDVRSNDRHTLLRRHRRPRGKAADVRPRTSSGRSPSQLCCRSIPIPADGRCSAPPERMPSAISCFVAATRAATHPGLPPVHPPASAGPCRLPPTSWGYLPRFVLRRSHRAPGRARTLRRVRCSRAGHPGFPFQRVRGPELFGDATAAWDQAIPGMAGMTESHPVCVLPLISASHWWSVHSVAHRDA